ncbi:phosphatase PAP2 family protein [Marinactinospora rubrisoli]|uniref:Phosphatase PAP2 family protein n=1 Tax=Marinactinospora rubrisoli TaxID=2715399 RepID=A0ABW2KCC0_9ACTN
MTFRNATSAAGWWRPHVLGLAVATAALAAVTWQVVSGGPLTVLDWPVHEVVDARQPTGAPLALCVAVARLGQRWLTAPVLLGLAAWVSWRRRDRRPLLAAATGLASLAVAGTLLKVAVGRTPPVVGLDAVSPGLENVAAWLAAVLSPGGPPYDGFVSFPSGHTANAALTYPLLAWLLFGRNGRWPDPRALRWALAGAAVPVLAVGVMMTVLDYHWASEALGGWALGIAVALLGRLALGPGDTGAVPPGIAPPTGRRVPADAGFPGPTGPAARSADPP